MVRRFAFRSHDKSTAFRADAVNARNLHSSVRSYSDLDLMILNCQNNSGDTISFQGLSPVVVLNVTVDCKKGGKITKMIDLKKIGKYLPVMFYQISRHSLTHAVKPCLASGFPVSFVK